MSEPTTAAGRAMLEVWGDYEPLRSYIVDAEAEAVAAYRKELAERVRGLTQFQFWPNEEPEAVLRADVLRLIEPTDEETT